MGEFKTVSAVILLLAFALFGAFSWLYLYIEFYPAIVGSGILFGLLFNAVKYGVVIEKNGFATKLFYNGTNHRTENSVPGMDFHNLWTHWYSYCANRIVRFFKRGAR